MFNDPQNDLLGQVKYNDPFIYKKLVVDVDHSEFARLVFFIRMEEGKPFLRNDPFAKWHWSTSIKGKCLIHFSFTKYYFKENISTLPLLKFWKPGVQESVNKTQVQFKVLPTITYAVMYFINYAYSVYWNLIRFKFQMLDIDFFDISFC